MFWPWITTAKTSSLLHREDSLSSRGLNGDWQSRVAGGLGDGVDEGGAEVGGLDLDGVAGLVLPFAGAVAELAGAEEMEVDIAGVAVLGILEVMIFQVRQRVGHVFFAGEKFSAVVDRFAVARDGAEDLDVLEIVFEDQFRAEGALPQF